MAVDREFKVRVSTVSDVSGARSVREALTDVGKAGEAAQEGIREKTESMVGAQRQAKAAIQGLALEFPAVAQVARLALNPIALAVAGITSAIGIWNWRMRESQSVMSGLSLSSAPALDPDRINAAAKAWQQYSGEIAKVESGLAGVERMASRSMELLEARLKRERELMEARQKTQGGGTYETIEAEATARSTELGARQEVIDAKRAEAAELERAAAEKVAKAGQIRVGSAEDEATLGKTWSENEQAAKEAREKAMDRMAELRGYMSGEGSTAQRLSYPFKYVARYGYMSPAQAEEQEELNIDQANAVIEGSRRFRRAGTYRGQARDLRGKLYDEAGNLREKAASLGFDADTNQQILNEDAAAARELNRLGAISTLSAAIEDSEQKAEQLKSQALSAKNATGAVMNEAASKLIQLTSEMNRMKEDLRRMETIQGGQR